MIKKFAPILLILLLAFALRAYALTDIPPGLTHDEANHGREALDILDGVLLFYFPLNYGSEPLYSYTVAGTMLLFGKSLFSLRLVNVVFGVAAIGATYLWTARAFDRRMGLLTAVLLTLSFWPLAGSRQALRAGMLPFFMMGAVWFFWQLIEKQDKGDQQKIKWGVIIGFGVCVAGTLHIYLAARVVWLLFPLFLVYLAIAHRDKLRLVWLPTLIGLGLAGILVTPMFIYLQRYPYALTRLDMLDGPLQQLTSGNFKPILSNITGALLAFVWPGFGDQFLAYNIPGRPVFDGITAVFFIIGLVVAAWRWKRPSYAFLLLWFFVGIVPSLVTGATANTTRNLAALPVAHILPVIGFLAVVTWVQKRLNNADQRVWMGAAAIWLALVAGITLNDYFVRWGTRPDVRDAYQHTLIEEVNYLQTNQVKGTIIKSSVYPGPAHDPSINLVMTGGEPLDSRWVDARFALVLPAQVQAHAIIPASTPHHPLFESFLIPIETINLQPDDLNPYFTYYELDETAVSDWLVGDPLANFANAIVLQDAKWSANEYVPGDVAELLTVWQVTAPEKVGPIVPPAFTTDVVMFTHVLKTDGGILTQADALDAPSWSWQSGDIVLQIHQMWVPPETPAGHYEAVVGIYDRTSNERRPLMGADAGGTVAPVPPLIIR